MGKSSCELRQTASPSSSDSLRVFSALTSCGTTVFLFQGAVVKARVFGAILVNNITTGERLIRELQECDFVVPCVSECHGSHTETSEVICRFGLDQLKALQRSYGILQQDIFQFQKNQSSMEMKFTYDLSRCVNRMKEVKEQCEERVEETTRKRNEAVVSRDAGERNDQPQQDLKPQPKLQQMVPPKEQVPQGKGDVPTNKSQAPAPSSEVLKPHKQNEEASEVQGGSEKHGLGPQKASVQELAPVNGTVVGAGKLQTTQVPVDLLARPQKDSQDPERDQLVIQGREKQHPAEERDQQNLGDEYNMDENEAESERDKQAVLAGNDRDTYVFNADDQKRGPINLSNGDEKQQSLIQNQVEVHIPQQA
ncbi:Golgi membrane protein 1 [Cricetulus griseus]|uniref:Golgi membrane protein 1 n=1 Tax=Cricetulus griseus TaxID=10029 RepID=G3IAW1_CRIGR|nr:Golgi membrane protein 1 [Cricetulus griseus]ERE78372.1 Golgi membrane protein 1 [Cricetulus griseus]